MTNKQNLITEVKEALDRYNNADDFGVFGEISRARYAIEIECIDWLQQLVTELEKAHSKNQLLKNYLLELADSTNSEIIQAQIGNVLKEVFE